MVSSNENVAPEFYGILLLALKMAGHSAAQK
jgi:hypothetical protein